MAIINTSKNTHKPAPKPAVKPVPKKTTAYIPDRPKTVAKPVPVSKQKEIYKDHHKPAPKPVYTPPKAAPKGKMEDIYKDHHKPAVKAPLPKQSAAKPIPNHNPKSPSTAKPIPNYVPPKKTVATKPAAKAPATKTPAAKAPVTKAPAAKAPVTAPPKVVAPPPLAKRDANGTVGPTNNGANNWNSNQSIPDYGAMQPEMIKDIQNGYQNPASYDAANDQVYQSMLLLANKQAAAAGLASMEQMNDRGILNSTMTTDRDQQIRQGASDAVIGAIPELAGNWQNQQNHNQAGYLNLLQTVMGGGQFQQTFAEGNRRFDKGYQLDEAGVTGTYNSAEAVANGQVKPVAGVQTLKAQDQYAQQKLANDKLAWDKQAFGQELQYKKDTFDREMNFQEQDSAIKNHLASRGLDLEEIKVGTDRFVAESDASYKLRQEQSGLSEQQASANTNKAIGTILGATTIEEGFAFLESMTNEWGDSGVDFRDVINALESKFPGTKEALSGGGDYDTGYGTTP